ncbi:MAG: diguanylate cyclase [Luteimonas sp.]
MTPKLPPFDQLLDLVPDAVCVVDADGTFLYVSGSFERILGYTRDEVLGRRAFELVHPDNRAGTEQQAAHVMGGAFQRHFRNRYVHKDGHAVDIQWSARWHPEFGVRIAVAREVSELRLAEQALEHLATHDALTGLPNRHQLQLALHRALDQASALGDRLALLYLDLDGFKAVNDRGGHGVGDRLLREVATRLRQGLRQSDLVARVGGDEFVVLLYGCHDSAAAATVADTLRARLRPVFSLPEGDISLDASIGIACFPADGSDAESLLSHADNAMYAVKRQQALADQDAIASGSS